MQTHHLDDLLVTVVLPRPNGRHGRHRPLAAPPGNAERTMSHDSIVPAQLRELSESIDRISRMINTLTERREDLIEERYELMQKAGCLCEERITA